MDKLFKLKKKPESYPFQKMCVYIYIYLKHNMAMYIFLVLIKKVFLKYCLSLEL